MKPSTMSSHEDKTRSRINQAARNRESWPRPVRHSLPRCNDAEQTVTHPDQLLDSRMNFENGITIGPPFAAALVVIMRCHPGSLVASSGTPALLAFRAAIRARHPDFAFGAVDAAAAAAACAASEANSDKVPLLLGVDAPGTDPAAATGSVTAPPGAAPKIASSCRCSADKPAVLTAAACDPCNAVALSDTAGGAFERVALKARRPTNAVLSAGPAASKSTAAAAGARSSSDGRSSAVLSTEAKRSNRNRSQWPSSSLPWEDRPRVREE